MTLDVYLDPPASNLKIIRVFRTRILTWYKSYGRNFPWREPSRSGYEKVVAEVLLQRTRAEVVATHYSTFLEHFHDWSTIVHADEEEIGNYLKPLGLWKRRSASLKLLAEAVTARNGILPTSREELEVLPGIGQYIANAILLLCKGEPNPLLDVNMARVLERFFGPRKLTDIRYDPGLQALARLLTDHKRSIEINWAILDFASLVCRPFKPACPACPLRDKCSYAINLSSG